MLAKHGTTAATGRDFGSDKLHGHSVRAARLVYKRGERENKRKNEECGENFDIYLLEGGLPGAGWEPRKERTKLSGGSKDGKIEVRDEAGTSTATLAEGTGRQDAQAFPYRARKPDTRNPACRRRDHPFRRNERGRMGKRQNGGRPPVGDERDQSPDPRFVRPRGEVQSGQRHHPQVEGRDLS
jgi:hypothetical protein